MQSSTQKDILEDEAILKMLNIPSSRDRAFRLLLQKYQERLYWHIRRIVIEHEDTNDVLQNTCIRIYKGIKSFKGNARLYTWLYRIASNEAITFLKKRKKIKSTSIDNEENNLENRLHADVYFEGDEIQKKLQLALDTLPEKQRLVFDMRYYDAMSYQAISDVLGTSVGGLKASYHHAAKKVEAFLTQE
ncbi:MAG: RNA polymerase sigma factor [Saprospiraceae bacterium]